AGFLRNLNRIANVIAMTVSQQDVIDFRHRGERILIVLTFRIGWITQPRIDEEDFSVWRGNREGCVAEPFQFRLLSRSLRRECEHRQPSEAEDYEVSFHVLFSSQR